MDVDISDEDYVIHRAKSLLTVDPIAAKAWMITAKTLYPNNFSVQFEAYQIEKRSGHVKEAAKYFSDLLVKFRQEAEFWKEIDEVTAALQSEAESNNPDRQLLCDMFRHISLEVQHQLLLFTADRCDDTMEHCHLLLLLLQKFPMSISTHGPKLVDTLLTAEKHSHASTQPLNNYRKLLVCDLLPLLASDKTSIDLPPKMLYKLLNKSIEFYLHSILKVASNVQELRIEDPWKRLFEIIHFIGRHLGWEPYLTEFTPDWTKEKYWPKILMFCQKFKSVLVEDHGYTKQLFYCLTIFFLHCLASYSASLNPETAPGQTQITFLLVEAFSDPSISKRHKGDNHVPVITVDKAEYKEIINNFTMLVNCWDMLHSSTHLYKEFQKLSADIKLDVWFNPFLIDYSMYKGHYDNCLSRLEQVTDPFLVSIRLANILYLKKDFTACFERILLTIQALPARTTSPLSTQLTVGGNQRHMHFLSLTHNSVLQLCVKLLLRCIRENLAKQTYNELGIGHILVLLQFDWPQEEDLLPTLVEQIRQRGAFSYMLFQGYIINVDILEELTYLATEQGGQITLDILPHLGQRRIGTRGADKGAREEIRLAIRRQIARSNEALDQLMVKFISQERGHILQSLM